MSGDLVLRIAELDVRSRMILIAGVLFYFIPWVVAIVRSHPRRGAIALLTLLLGWTVIGWIIALIWAAKPIRHDGQKPD